MSPSFQTKTVFSNYRIEVIPSEIYVRGVRQRTDHDTRQMELREAVAKIERHIDDIDSVEARWNTDQACVHCDTTVAMGCLDSGEPACCDEAIAEWVASGGVPE
jgi:hypothetical protein